MRQHFLSVATMCFSLILLGVILSWSCAPQPPGIEGKIEFSLKTSKKAKRGARKGGEETPARPADAPPLFIPADDHKIEARVTLTGLQPGKQEVVHLVWLKPDGNELFRKVEEFVPEKSTETFSSRITISPDKERDPGKYAFKVYRHRRLLATEVFEIGEPSKTGESEEKT